MKLVLAGGSSHTDDYVARLRDRQSERIKFLPWLSGDALKEVLTNACIFVLPSDIEGLSLALLDAMGAGVCVLASDVPENMEAMGDAGFAFKHGNVHDLQQMLAWLLSNPVARENVGRRAKERVRQQYLWETAVTETQAVYSSLFDLPQKTLSGQRKGIGKAA